MIEPLTAEDIQVGFFRWNLRAEQGGLPETQTLSEMLCVHSIRCGIGTKDLRGPSRVRHISQPRQDFMLKAIEAGYSYPRVGRFLGDRDHTTIIHGVRAARKRIEEARK